MEVVLKVLEQLYGELVWPPPFHLLHAVDRLKNGVPVKEIARDLRTTAKRIDELRKAANPIVYLVGADLSDINDETRSRVRQTLAQLLVGRAAEIAFEAFYRAEIGTQEFQLVDLRESRTDTDYRLLNGRKRPVYRINIKFIGSTFRRSSELVGLEPDDCFPLATYKIFSALKKQEQEHLPYIFLVVFERTLNVELIGKQIPEDFIQFMSLLRLSNRGGLSRRLLEDRMVDWMVHQQSAAFVTTYGLIQSAAWYVLSARKADRLLRELLFDRVYALKIRGFAQQFRRAELDMHFSLEQDLTPLREFLKLLRERGQPTVTSMLERGTV